MASLIEQLKELEKTQADLEYKIKAENELEYKIKEENELEYNNREYMISLKMDKLGMSLDNIDNIDKIDKIYTEVLALNTIILNFEQSNIKFPSRKDLVDYSINLKKLDEFREQSYLYRHARESGSMEAVDYVNLQRITTQAKIKELDQRTNLSTFKRVYEKVAQLYERTLINYNLLYNPNKSLLILVPELKHFYLSVTQRLYEIYTVYESEEVIVDILEFLHMKRIKHLESSSG